MHGRSAGFGLYPDSNIFYSPYRPYFACGFAAISLGVAERMLVAFKEKPKTACEPIPEPAWDGHPGADASGGVHPSGCCRPRLFGKTWQEHAEHGRRHQYPSHETLTFWRTNQAYAVKMCIESVDRLFSAAGATSWMESNEIQRLFRDSHDRGTRLYRLRCLCTDIRSRVDGVRTRSDDGITSRRTYLMTHHTEPALIHAHSGVRWATSPPA